jgi:hypothetical protein
MKYTGTPVDAVDMPVPYEASTVSSFQRFSTVFDRMQEFDDAYVRCTIVASTRWGVNIVTAEFMRLPNAVRRIHNMMCSRPRARRKDFLEIPTLDSWACTRKSGHWSRGRDESFPHVVGRLFRTCGVGVDLVPGTNRWAAVLFVRSSAFDFSAP